jgi:uncharacterized protein (TIGR03382 family)
MRREFGPLFEKHGVDLVLTGHDHNYERTWPMKGDGVAPSGTRGVPYLVVGSGGATLRGFAESQPAWSLVRNNKDYGYLDVVIEEGTLTARLLTPSGAAVDSFTLTKQLAPRAQPEPPPPPPAPTLSLAVEGERGASPSRSVFRATTTLANATVRWDFGDGQTGEGVEVAHTYAAPGTYRVTATASNGSAQLTSATEVAVTASGPAQGETPPAPTEPPPAAPPAGTTPPVEATPPAFPPDDPDEPGKGCATVPAATLLPAALLGLAGLRRRRRRRC